MLEREGRRALAEACFSFLPVRGTLDLGGWAEPDVFAQVALALQPPLPVRHSLTSVQPVEPLPEYPEGHAPQVKEPTVFVQTVSGSQPPLPVRHSFTSTHVLNPPTVPWVQNEVEQAQL